MSVRISKSIRRPFGPDLLQIRAGCDDRMQDRHAVRIDDDRAVELVVARRRDLDGIECRGGELDARGPAEVQRPGRKQLGPTRAIEVERKIERRGLIGPHGLI